MAARPVGPTPADGRRRHGTAVGSAALADPLTGHRRPWRVMGMSTHGWWCADRRHGRRRHRRSGGAAPERRHRPTPAPRLVAGVVVARRTSLAGRRRGGHDAEQLEWRIVRWWDPRVAPIDADPNDGRPAWLRSARRARAERRREAVDRGPPGRRSRGDSSSEAGRLIGSGAGAHARRRRLPDRRRSPATATAAHSLGDRRGTAMLEQLRRPVLTAARRIDDVALVRPAASRLRRRGGGARRVVAAGTDRPRQPACRDRRHRRRSGIVPARRWRAAWWPVSPPHCGVRP